MRPKEKKNANIINILFLVVTYETKIIKNSQTSGHYKSSRQNARVHTRGNLNRDIYRYTLVALSLPGVSDAAAAARKVSHAGRKWKHLRGNRLYGPRIIYVRTYVRVRGGY